ncbi:Protein kinase domain-containing protein [Forsythia ovata]|uniref:Protein kinase domain-containing protein n=1 Tax=Forsythia ovata TaxID=205694 RepID=A0ABD1VJX7_9LAMI
MRIYWELEEADPARSVKITNYLHQKLINWIEMVIVYDNWERLVGATLKREELRRVAREDSSSSFSSMASDLDLNFRLNELSLNFENLGISFTYREILQATGNFSDVNLIKHGHSGDFFFGILEESIRDSSSVVVKRIFDWEACLLELDFFSKVSSRRFVPLLGHCLEEGNEKFLVYKYMTNEDLSSSLLKRSDHDDKGFAFLRGDDERLGSLDWITRLKIAIGVAEGLAFLHHECDPPLVHG